MIAAAQTHGGRMVASPWGRRAHGAGGRRRTAELCPGWPRHDKRHDAFDGFSVHEHNWVAGRALQVGSERHEQRALQAEPTANEARYEDIIPLLMNWNSLGSG